MSEHAHDHWSDPPSESPSVSASRPAGLTLKSFVEREIAAKEAEGRTMAAWLNEIEFIPGLDSGWATAAIRELREADDPRELG